MIWIRPTITYTATGAGMRKGFPAIRNAVFQAVGVRWHKQMLPAHFTQLAMSRYGFQKREWPPWMKDGKGRPLEEKKPYNTWKQKKYGHTKPMVQTGGMQQELQGHGEIRSSSRGFRIKMTSPRLNLSSPKNIARGYPDFRKEITAITGGELQKLAEYADKLMERALQDLQQRRVKRF